MRVFILLLPLTFFISTVTAQPLAVTNTFSNTTVADADQVNQNFVDVQEPPVSLRSRSPGTVSAVS